MPRELQEPFEQLYFVDHYVQSLGGHHYEFIRSVMDASRRLEVPSQFLVDRRADPDLVAETGALPVFDDFETPVARAAERAIWQRFPRVASLWFCAWQNRRFYQMLQPCFDRLSWQRSLLIVPHCYQGTVGAFARALRGRLDHGSRALLVFFTLPSKVTFPLAFRTITGLVRAGKVIVGCDSKPLADHYTRLTGLPFHVVPMPYQVPLAGSEPPRDAIPRPLHLLSPGEMRQEKGTDILVQALSDLAGPLGQGRVRFTFQTYLNPVRPDPVAVRERARLLDLAGQYPRGTITLIDEPLGSDAYHALLRECDALVLPYRLSGYAIRTSGVLMEGLALGKPLITTADTWLSLQMQSNGVGFTAPDGDARALAAAIARLLDDYPQLAQEAVLRKESWRKFHNPENYLRTVCELGRATLNSSLRQAA